MTEQKQLVLIDKPVGITSFDVIRQLRRKLNTRKMGHAGTLDPLASGLILIGIGAGTKQLSNYVKLDKEYVAEILVGQKRSTGDMEGVVLEEVAVTSLDEGEVRRTLAEMVGTLTLPVSAYSAIKKDGVPMYKRARAAEKKGETIDEVPIRDMKVYEAELMPQGDDHIIYDKNCAVVKVRFLVGSGTYIRSLAEEFGKRLGYPATLYSLRRTKVGEFTVEDAEQL